MKGDNRYHQFYWNILILLISVILMTISDNLILFLGSWSFLNWTLVKLIVHKSTWKAAKASGKIATQNFTVGFCSIMLAFACMYQATGSLSIQYILDNAHNSWYMLLAAILLLIGAMTQSAIWPFHRWLTSSLNSPTPVSAIMHAGIVNGGGFLLARFAPLYFNNPTMLNIIFTVGLTTALMGSLWKLMQHDVKRMLACSTMGQMGFMFAQCGLGLFPAAVAHICWHGMFKAYLFLASSGVTQEQRHDLNYAPNLISFAFSLACGALGSYIFSLLLYESWFPLDSRIIIIGIIYISVSQLALTALRDEPLKRLPITVLLISSMASLYSANIYLFEIVLSPLNNIKPQPLNIIHLSALLLLMSSWLCISFIKYTNYKFRLPNLILSLYVKTLNSSQPHPATITTHRMGYDYV